MKNLGDQSKLLLGMIIFGSVGLFVKPMNLPGTLVAFIRACLGFLVLLIFGLATKKSFAIANKKRNLPVMIVSGIAMGFNWVLLFGAYRYTSVANATFVYYMAPIIVLAVSPFLLGTPVLGRQLASIAVALVGMFFISGTGGSLGSGLYFALGAAVLYACVVILNQKIQGVGALQSTVVQLGSAAVVLGVSLIFTKSYGGVVLNPKVLLLLVCVGVVHTGIAYLLYFGSVGKLPTFTVAIYSYVDPLVAVVLSLIILGEPLGLGKLVGGALILFSSLYAAMAERKQDLVQM